MKNLDWNIYTFRHRRAFEYCVRKLIHEPELRAHMLERARVHDMDKMLMYLFLDQQTAQKRHVKNQPHHLENDLPKSYEDLVETVIDYECAPYTKPDKPLNAYDFVLRLYEMKLLDDEMKGRLLSIMADLGIDHSYSFSEDRDWAEYSGQFREVTEEMILAEILRYVHEEKDNDLEEILKTAGDAGKEISEK